jgi:hypothetical protein
MNQILLDFDKLFATINHVDNNFKHLNVIQNMINVFELKYKQDFGVSTQLLVKYARMQFDELKQRFNVPTENKTL